MVAVVLVLVLGPMATMATMGLRVTAASDRYVCHFGYALLFYFMITPWVKTRIANKDDSSVVKK